MNYIYHFITGSLTKEELDKTISFISGDLTVMLLAWLHFDFNDLLTKMIATLILGIIGGAAGLLGKDLYTFFKEKLNAFRRK